MSAYSIANTVIKNSQVWQKANYDQKTKRVTLNVGNRLFVKVVAYEGKHEIADRWEDHPCLKLSQPNTGIPVFKLRREDGVGRCKTLYRNLLLPIGTKISSSTPIPAPRRMKSRK
jgi:hypothetical protein